MVSFFCDNCGETSKKKQAERHMGYCGGPMSCIQCRKVFTTVAEIKEHTRCGDPPAKPKFKSRATATSTGKKLTFYDKHKGEAGELSQEEALIGSKGESRLIRKKNSTGSKMCSGDW